MHEQGLRVRFLPWSGLETHSLTRPITELQSDNRSAHCFDEYAAMYTKEQKQRGFAAPWHHFVEVDRKSLTELLGPSTQGPFCEVYCQFLAHTTWRWTWQMGSCKEQPGMPATVPHTASHPENVPPE